MWKLSATGKAVFRVMPDGSTESHGLDSPEIVAWLALGNTPLPNDEPASETISYSDLRLRLTDGERQAILTACRSNWQLDDFVRLAQAYGEINLASQTTTDAKNALVVAGLFTQDRADVVFAAG